MKLRLDIRQYFPTIANYYWDHLDPQIDGSIWDWLGKDYQVVKVGPVGSKPELWVTFPDEQHLSLFLLRWS